MVDIPKIGFKRNSKQPFDIELLTVQDLFSQRSHLSFRIDRPHQVSFFHLIYVTKGAGKHLVDFRPYEFKRGSLIFVSVGQVHAFDLDSGMDGQVVLFTERFVCRNAARADKLAFARLYNPFFEVPIIQSNVEEGQAFDSLFREMSLEYSNHDDSAKEPILSLLLKVILLKAQRIQGPSLPLVANAESFSIFESFRKLLGEHIRRSRNAQDYAEMLNISYKHLNELSKRVTGQTAKASIDQFLILELKRELALSDASVKELTHSFAFDEPTNLIKFFRKNVGKSPAKFRESLRMDS
jgi:AraC family transcriptional regulator, transcriptional activator of pobA